MLGSLSSTTRSLNFDPVDILAWMVLFCRFFPVHRCLAASLISAHKMSLASTSPPVTTVNNVGSVPWAKGGKGGKNQSHLRTTNLLSLPFRNLQESICTCAKLYKYLSFIPSHCFPLVYITIVIPRSCSTIRN